MCYLWPGQEPYNTGSKMQKNIAAHCKIGNSDPVCGLNSSFYRN